MPLEFLSAFSLAQVLGGIVGNRSDRLFYENWLRLKENLAALTPDANHDLRRAINCSYCQATLQNCAVRCEQLGVDVDAWLRSETLLGALRKPEEWLGREPLTTIFSEQGRGPTVADRLRDRVQRGRLQGRLYSLLDSEEVLWLDRGMSDLRRRLTMADGPAFTDETVVPDDELGGLLRPKGVRAEEAVRKLRGALVARVGRELEVCYGALSDEISSLIERHWFDFFCANFQYALKHDEQVFRIFMVKSQANMRGGLLDGMEVDGVPLTLEQVRRQVEALGGELGRRIERSAKEIEGRQQAGFDEVRRDLRSLLPVVALVSDSSKIIERLPDLLRDTAADIKAHASRTAAESESKIIGHADGRFDVLESLLTARDRRAIGRPELTPASEPLPDLEKYHRVVVEEFEHLPRSPIPRGDLPTGDLEPVRLVKLSPGDSYPEVLDLQEVVSSTPRFVIVGPSGSGKTTALRWLTYTLSKQALGASGEDATPETAVPVFVDLSLYENSLTSLIEESLDARGIPLRDGALKGLTEQHRVLLLLDGYDLVRNRRRFRADLDNLTRKSPEVRFVLTSRPLQAAAVALLDAPRYEVSSLRAYQIKEIFRLHLDDGRAAELFRLLESRRLLDAFRQPLTAELVSLVYREPVLDSFLSAKGLLYQEVISRVLKDWEAQRSETVDPDLDLKLGCLARVGYEMVLRDQPYLEMQDALNCFVSVIRRRGEGRPPPPAAHLLDQLTSAGVLVKSGSGLAERVSFWHQSFGEYFAAVWLKPDYKLSKILRWSVRPQWHETVVFLVSLLEDSEVRRLLRWMLKVARLSALVSAIGPNSWAANQLFLLLRCLNNTQRPHDDLKDRFVEMVSGRQVFLSSLTVPTEQVGRFSDFENAYFEFNSLIAQLGTSRSREYLLKEGTSRRYQIYGLGQLREIGLLTEVFKGEPDKDSMTESVAADFLLKYPSDVLLPELAGFFEVEDAESKRRLLRAISFSLAAGQDKEERPFSELENSTRWFELLTSLALTDEDDEVRDSAFSVIRNTAAEGLRVPGVVERMLLEALRGEDVEAKENAVWYLVYSESPESLAAAVEALDDDSLWVNLRALSVLELRDSSNLPDHIVKVLRRRYRGEFAVEELLDIRVTTDEAPEVQSKISTLAVGALGDAIASFRRFSVKSLAILGFEAVAPILKATYQHDEDERVREASLWGLADLLGGRAEEYLSQALEDPLPRIRRAAAIAINRRNLPRDVVDRLLPRLRTLMVEDPSKEMRSYAKITVEQCDRDALSM